MSRPNRPRLVLSYEVRRGSTVIPPPQGLRVGGPTVQVVSSLHSHLAQKRMQAGLPIPRVPGLALIDSGASVTTIDAEIARKLGLRQTGQIESFGIGGKTLGFTAACCVDIRGLKVDLSRVPCHDLSTHAHGLAALIGRDVLAHMVFHYDGPKGEVYLELPGAQQPPKSRPKTPQRRKDSKKRRK